ncbi:MAG: hypothetical protein ACR2IE_02580 [Candidatus Sumerlaeaceae bacterium]
MKKHTIRNWWPLCSLCTLLAMAGCADHPAHAEKLERDDNVERLKRGTSETLSAAGALAVETKDQAQTRLEKEVKKLDVNLADLKTRVARAGADAKARIQEQLPDLERRKEELEKKLDDLKTRSGKAWDEMATGTEAALGELRKSFEKAKSHFD